ncbi:MAG: DsrE/DsrF/DrsH-like family protein, partial [bacterium]|nr:DsrE/DsrF/DrsH-like family protein [bacterium]
GGVIRDRERLLVQTPKLLYDNLRIDVRTRTEALAIDRARKEVTVKNLPDGVEQAIHYDKLILSPGAEPIRLSVPGADDRRVRTLRSLADMDDIIRLLDDEKPSRALVVGGGYIGLEMAEALVARGVEVTLLELSAQVMAPVDPEMASPLHQQLRLHGVDLRLETSLTSLQDEGKVLSARLSTGESLDCGLVIMAAGVRPETGLAARAGLDIGERGGIAVDDHMRTSDPDILAVGDAVEVRDFVGEFPTLIPLAGPANRQGRIAADNALGRDSVYSRTQGTGICKVFDLAVGMTGLNEKTLRRLKKSYQKIYIHPANHAGYYPDASPISLKLLFDPAGGRILGAQAVGAEGVDKRIDVLAVAIRAGLSVYDLEDLELSYAPPYGSAKDPVNYAGFVAGNHLRGDAGLCHYEEIINPREDQLLLDVRNREETAAGTIPGALNIPLPELRDRLAELPQDKEILVFCQVGLRGYLACRILSQKGFKCRNLTGGYKTFTMFGGSGGPVSEHPREMCDDTGSACAVKKDIASGNQPAARVIDACGLQCPGPIMRLSEEMKSATEGETVTVLSTDPGFAADIGPWCRSTGNTLVEVVPEDNRYRAVVVKGAVGVQKGGPVTLSKNKTIVVFSGEFDKAVAAFVIANGAAAMGSDVTMFFTFWGLNILRRQQPVKVHKNVIERMMGWMMPRGAGKLKLSNMHMGGMGLAMIKGIMRKKNVSSLEEFIESARRSGVRLVACTMSMDLMGIKREELIDGVDEGGVATYLDKAEAGGVNLFI